MKFTELFKKTILQEKLMKELKIFNRKNKSHQYYVHVFESFVDGERDPSQEAPSPVSVLISPARHEFKQETNTQSGNERASLFTKHTITKLQAGTWLF